MTLLATLRQVFFNPTWTSSNLPDLSGKVAIVTGASAGIGKEVALALAEKGATVVLVGRNREKTTAVMEYIKDKSKNGNISLILCDFLDLATVKAAANEFLSQFKHLDILVNNAGMFGANYSVSAHGTEATITVNYLALVVFTNSLLNILKDTQNSRVVNVSSYLHEVARSVDLDISREKFLGLAVGALSAYGVSKLAVHHYSNNLQAYFDNENASVYVNCVHPGWVWTEIDSKNRPQKPWWTNPIKINSEKGAVTVLYAAGSPDIVQKRYKNKYFVPYSCLAENSRQSKDEQMTAETWAQTQDILSKILPDWSPGF
jgi:NAD(P)-dependent dehydrogenase (short-subunit alcohol dehydrogenase family)